MENTLSNNGFTLKEDKVLKDVNVEYFSPVKRTLSENQIFNLEHFVVAKTIDQYIYLFFCTNIIWRCWGV